MIDAYSIEGVGILESTKYVDIIVKSLSLSGYQDANH